jgi:coatomer subunit delta
MERITGTSMGSRNSMSGGPGMGGGQYDDYRAPSSSGARASSNYDSEPSPKAAAPAPAVVTSSANRMVLGAKKSGSSGLSLGARGGAASSLAGVIAEEGLRDRGDLDADELAPSSAAAAVAAAGAAAAAAVAHQVTVSLEERLTVKLTRDGAVELLEVKGSLTLTVMDESIARLKVILSRGDIGSFQFQTHPHINKNAFIGEGIVVLRAPEKPFPCSTPLGMVRWSRKLKDADLSSVPLALTCWPEASGNGMINVSLEYTLQDESLNLKDVVITVPLGVDAIPRVGSCTGNWKHNTRENLFTWHIDSISADASTGACEFSIKARDENAFFPVSVNFVSTDTLCPLTVRDVVTLDDENSLRFGAQSNLEVESYTVEP